MSDTLLPDNPYVGPRSIRTGEAFFGRDREIRSLSALLVAERIVLLHSPSGAGKSSLIQAGLIPTMSERFSILPVVRVNLEPPDEVENVEGLNRYVLSTLLSLEERLPRKERLPFTELAALTLDEYLEKMVTPEGTPENSLLIFDQFEEILTLSSTDAAVKQVFFEQVGAALQNRRRWALFSVREDYMGGLAPYVRAIPNRLGVPFRLGLLGPDASKVAIQQPSRDKNIDFLDSAAEKLVDDLRRIQVQQPDGSFKTEAGPHVEPVQLQVVCYNLWQSHAADDRVIDEDDLQRVGSVDQALANYYANAIKNVAELRQLDERVLRQWFDRNLITAEGIRTQVLKGSRVTEGLANNILRLLENTHLIRGETRAGKTWYELSHDRLVAPIRQDNLAWFEKNLSLLQRQAVLWNQQGRNEGLLLRGEALEEAEMEAGDLSLPHEEQDFLDACRTLRERELRDKHQRRLMLAGFVTTFVFLILSIVGFISANEQARQAVQAQDSAIAAALDAENQKSTAVFNADRAATAEARAIQNAEKASTAEAQAVENAYAASTAQAEAIVNANLAATAQANAENALERVESVVIYRAQALVAFSIEKTRTDFPGALLLSVEAFNLLDNFQTRSRLMDLVGIESTQLSADYTEKTGTYAVKISPNGRTLATAHTNGAIGIWNLTTRQLVRQLSTGDKGVYDVAFSPDGRTLASADFGNQVILWNLQTFEPIGEPLLAHDDLVYSVAFSPDGAILVSGGADGRVIFWDAKTGKKVNELPQQTDKIFSVVFSVDGKLLALAERGGNITFWDVASQQKVGPTLTDNRLVNTLAFSPDGKTLASGHENANIVLWDVDLFRKMGTSLRTQSQRVSSVAFNFDGKILASASHDNTIVIWDVASGLPLDTLNSGAPNNSVAFSPDGNILASGGSSADGVSIIFLWDLNPQNWIAKACEQAGRNLTRAEWEQFFPGEPYRQTCPQWPDGQ
jgi:Tol biopolymer transport system component